MAIFRIYNSKNREVVDRKIIVDGVPRQVVKVYHLTASKAMIVWENIRSCFGKGFWVNLQTWGNTDNWKN